MLEARASIRDALLSLWPFGRPPSLCRDCGADIWADRHFPWARRRLCARCDARRTGAEIAAEVRAMHARRLRAYHADACQG